LVNVKVKGTFHSLILTILLKRYFFNQNPLNRWPVHHMLSHTHTLECVGLSRRTCRN